MIENISQLAPYLADEGKARELFERLRWPDGPVCPRCDHKDRIYKLQGKSTRPGLYKCGNCRKPFSVKVGSVFEGSHIPLKKWLYAIYLMCSSKKGVSAKQLERELDLTYKSAWFMCHRIRHAMTQPPLVGKLGGTVEVDETYIGGKVHNTHALYTGVPKGTHFRIPAICGDSDRYSDLRDRGLRGCTEKKWFPYRPAVGGQAATHHGDLKGSDFRSLRK